MIKLFPSNLTACQNKAQEGSQKYKKTEFSLSDIQLKIIDLQGKKMQPVVRTAIKTQN